MESAPKVCSIKSDGTPDVCCKLPDRLMCDPGSGACWCQAPPATVEQMACEVRITYPAGTPRAPEIAMPNPAWCDAAGIELAMAIALARLLGAKP